MPIAAKKKLLQLARALTAEDLRALAVEVGMPRRTVGSSGLGRRTYRRAP